MSNSLEENPLPSAHPPLSALKDLSPTYAIRRPNSLYPELLVSWHQEVLLMVRPTWNTMSPDPSPTSTLDLTNVRVAFMLACRAGDRPAIESFLGSTPEPQRSALLKDLLTIEVEERVGRGEQPSLADYLPRFPDYEALIQDVFRKLVPLPSSAPPEKPVVPGVTLTVIEGPQAGRVLTIQGHDTFLVGRSRNAHFQPTARDRYFSRIHFMLEVNLPCCRLTDMGSHNGTFVNGQRVDSIDLHDGDQIKAGHTILSVALTMPPAEPTLTLPPVEPSPAAVSPPPAEENALPDIPGYRLVRELGRGSMGVLYEAIRQSDGARMALKTIVPAVETASDVVERFLREARILCQLEHPHIVAFREMGEADKVLFFAMDYIEGTDAEKLLKEHGPLPVRTAVRLVCQVLDALAYSHAQGFVHRDIKPANILLAEKEGEQIVKVADFGLARVYSASQMSGLTMQGEVAGTYAFMPPEQVSDFRSALPAADQYATAATLYNLLTDRYLYDFPLSSVASLLIILTKDPVPIGRHRPDLPARLGSVIHRALSREPKDRFPDVSAFRRALLPFAR
jgi:serine/threonine-protein kinase